MPLCNLKVTIHRSEGTPAKEILQDVASVAEMSDESQDENMTGISFYTSGGWRTFKLAEVSRIVIEVETH